MTCPGNVTINGDGGTPSVSPVSVFTYTGLPATLTFIDHEPGKTDATSVHGFVVGVGACAQPTIGAPRRSGTASTGPPWIVTVACPGATRTCPPCAQLIKA